MTQPARSLDRRTKDTLGRLDRDVDAWIATADRATGLPCLVPLSFLWDGSTVLLATPSASRTSRNLEVGSTVRLGIGPTRDVVLIEGTVDAMTTDSEIPDLIGDAFAIKAGFDPRTLPRSYVYIRIGPVSIQAWREANELAGRHVMRDGAWIDH